MITIKPLLWVDRPKIISRERRDPHGPEIRYSADLHSLPLRLRFCGRVYTSFPRLHLPAAALQENHAAKVLVKFSRGEWGLHDTEILVLKIIHVLSWL